MCFNINYKKKIRLYREHNSSVVFSLRHNTAQFSNTTLLIDPVFIVLFCPQHAVNQWLSCDFEPLFTMPITDYGTIYTYLARHAKYIQYSWFAACNTSGYAVHRPKWRIVKVNVFCSFTRQNWWQKKGTGIRDSVDVFSLVTWRQNLVVLSSFFRTVSKDSLSNSTKPEALLSVHMYW